MKVQVNGTTYRVSWRHYRKGAPWRSVTTGLPVCGATTCTIEGPPRFAGGIAECSIHDRFCKETGRKISFGRAVAQFDDDKALRTAFWKAYFGRKEAHP